MMSAYGSPPSGDFDPRQWQQQQINQGLQNSFVRALTPEETIANRIGQIDRELEQFSEERRQALLAERARLLVAQEALREKR